MQDLIRKGYDMMRKPGPSSNAAAKTPSPQKQKQKKSKITDYTKSPATFFDCIIYFAVGCAAVFIVFYIFYKILPLSFFGGLAGGFVNIYLSAKSAAKKRVRNFRLQFFDMLESLSVSMRAGNNEFNALKSAREDLKLLYSEKSDIIIELTNIINGFENAIPLSRLFSDLANRTGLEDIKSFASVFSVIEGKSGKSNEIVKQTQRIISEKMEIELEMETLLTSAKSEVNIMLVMPLVILLIVGYMGEGFLDAIYTTTVGRIVSTVSLGIFILSYAMSMKFTDIDV